MGSATNFSFIDYFDEFLTGAMIGYKPLPWLLSDYTYLPSNTSTEYMFPRFYPLQIIFQHFVVVLRTVILSSKVIFGCGLLVIIP